MAPELVIACHPTVGHLIPPPVEHLHTLLLACVIPHLQRHMACVASLCIPGPLLGQEQAEIEQRMVAARDVPHEHPNLAIVDLAPVAAPLTLDAHRVRASFGETAGIKRDDAIGFPQPSDDLTDQHLDQRPVIPGSSADEVLHDQALDLNQCRAGLSILAG
jgi:hypothetical protein